MTGGLRNFLNGDDEKIILSKFPNVGCQISSLHCVCQGLPDGGDNFLRCCSRANVEVFK